MGESIVFQDQLLATKFFPPSSTLGLVSRPHLLALLARSLECSLTLVSAPAGFGKTTLLSSWVQSLPTERLRIAWVSLDEEDNEVALFWRYVLTALDRELPGMCTELVSYLQTQQAPALHSVLQTLINRLSEQSVQFLLILDDYHLVNVQAIHRSLTYLLEHLPAQFHLILATRADPPLPLSLLRTRGRLLEVRTEHLRCRPDEVMALPKHYVTASRKRSLAFVPLLHHRASQWYTQHGRLNEAIAHAITAQQWQWAADLIEQASTRIWGNSEHARHRRWLEQIPAEVMRSRPRLCLAYAKTLFMIAATFLILECPRRYTQAVSSSCFTVDRPRTGTFGSALPFRSHINSPGILRPAVATLQDDQLYA